MAECGEAGESWRRVFRDKFRLLDKAAIGILEFMPFSELVDFGIKAVCILLEDADA